MTDEAAQIYSRCRRSPTSSKGAWARLANITESADWDTSWLEERTETSIESKLGG